MQFVFGDYVLDPDRRELTRGAEAIAIGPQVFDLLVYLVENRDHVVSKEGLLDVVWAGRIVSESTLTSHINAVRKAIGDSGQEGRLIRTIARKGFRFVGDVREAPSSDRKRRVAYSGVGELVHTLSVEALSSCRVEEAGMAASGNGIEKRLCGRQRISSGPTLASSGLNPARDRMGRKP